MKKTLLFLMLSILMISTAFAEIIEIGDNSSTYSTVAAPFYGLWEYSWSSMIIPADYFEEAMEINSLKFDVTNSPNNYSFLNQKVYLRHTVATSAGIAYPDPTNNGFTLVFDGDTVWNGSGWQGIEFDNTFDYNGTSNLEVVWENRNGSYNYGYPFFRGVETTLDRISYKRDHGSFPASEGMLSTDYPNMRIGYLALGAPGLPTLLTPEHEAVEIAIAATLTWTNGEDTENVDLYLSSTRDEVDANQQTAKVIDAQDVTSFSIILEYGTTYFWKVVARGGDNLTTQSNIFNFETVYGESNVITGTGDVNAGGLPYNPYYSYSYTQSLYLASEVSLLGDIVSIAYDFNGNSAFDENIVIYMGTTITDEFPDVVAWLPESQLTEVFNGVVSTTAEAGWVMIHLDTPFAYDGSANLVIAVDKNTGSYSTPYDYFYSYATNNNRSLK